MWVDTCLPKDSSSWRDPFLTSLDTVDNEAVSRAIRFNERLFFSHHVGLL